MENAKAALDIAVLRLPFPGSVVPLDGITTSRCFVTFPLSTLRCRGMIPEIATDENCERTTKKLCARWTYFDRDTSTLPARQPLGNDPDGVRHTIFRTDRSADRLGALADRLIV